MADSVEFWDPHFHIFDIGENTTSGHEQEVMFAPNGNPCYTTELYESDCDVAGDGFEHVGGAWLESLSVCHAGTSGPEYVAQCMAESRWTANELRKSNRNYVMIPTVPLEEVGAAEALAELAEEPMVRGIRQIINHQPDWPRNVHLGDLLDNPDWRRGFARLASHGMSFDLQLNPHQFAKAAAFIRQHPYIPVIIDHLGSPLWSDVTQDFDQYRAGMSALAACENTTIKISMLYYTAEDWNRHQEVLDAVHFVIDAFGTDRCFFASNYPVDIKFGWPADKLFPALRQIVDDRYDANTLGKLFSANAKRVYRAEAKGEKQNS